MIEWVLIVIVTGISYGNPGVTTVRFKNKDDCNAAVAVIVAQNKSHWADHYYAECFQDRPR